MYVTCHAVTTFLRAVRLSEQTFASQFVANQGCHMRAESGPISHIITVANVCPHVVRRDKKDRILGVKNFTPEKEPLPIQHSLRQYCIKTLSYAPVPCPHLTRHEHNTFNRGTRTRTTND